MGEKMLIIGNFDYRYPGIKTAEDVEKLGQRNLVAHVFNYPSSVEQWFPYPAVERRSLLDLWYKEKFEQIQAEVALRNIKLSKRGKYNSFDCELDANELPKLLAIDGITMVTISKIEGLKPIKQRERKRLEWYIVQARFIWEVEGQTQGMQMVEDQMLLVRAYDFDDAEQRLQQKFTEYGEPYLNTDGEMVRIRLDCILEVFRTNIMDKVDPKGEEIFYTIKHRRMRPEYEWHPLRDQKPKEKAE
ncbi:MAG: DUF4288 domain-containing protein [Chloroflexi bacterium]|nr:DUF4288 domain-containing protein [Chloroflexota bacterium]